MIIFLKTNRFAKEIDFLAKRLVAEQRDPLCVDYLAERSTMMSSTHMYAGVSSP